MKHYTYKCLHIPSGQVFDRQTLKAFWNHTEFLIELNKWNRCGPDWKYWTEEI